MVKAVEAHRDYVAEQTLANTISFDAVCDGAYRGNVGVVDAGVAVARST